MALRPLWQAREPRDGRARVLLIGPYDPHCGEYTFIAPPLGVWRLKGYIESIGHDAAVFDPNCCDGEPEAALVQLVRRGFWDVIGISTTGMTLRYDLSLAHIARHHAPGALLVAGGMEATFDPDLLFSIAPVDLVVLGEGEAPMREIVRRLCTGAPLTGVPGTAVPLKSGGAQRFHGTALDYEALRDSIALTPYDAMPYERYWQRLEEANRIDALPYKAEREARLAEIRSVRLITLNYCPMACTFCSSTNFLHSAQGSVAKIARLTAEDCMRMIEKIVEAQPLVRSIIFQDDIFVFTNDKRIEDLCQRITRAKTAGHIPRHLEFISTNRIDAMTDDRLRAMRGAGFRVVGFGVESFSKSVLEEFNKGQIHRHIAPALRTALKLGLTPFLDLILCSPRSSLQDIVDTVSGAFSWITAGCEVGLYPYVVPFSGAQMSRDPELAPFIVSKEQTIPGTEISWSQPEHIMPIDAGVRRVLKEIVTCYGALLTQLSNSTAHIPSRVRSLLWVASALPVLRKAGAEVPDAGLMIRKLRRECGLNELREVA